MRRTNLLREIFLSEVYMDMKEGGAQLALANPKLMHGVILSAFEDADRERVRSEKDILYRIEGERVYGFPRVLVQASEKPEWRRARPGVFVDNSCSTKEVSSSYEELDVGHVLRFEIVISPRRKFFGRQECDGRFVKWNGEARGWDQIVGWFSDREPTLGFRLVQHGELVVSRHEKVRMGGGNEPRAIMGFSRVMGLLEVRDRKAFLQTLRSGLGRHRSYGCGLLSLAPVGV